MTHSAEWIGRSPAIARVNNSRRGGRGGAGSLLRRGEHPRFASDGSRGGGEDEEAEGAWYDAQAGLLADRWTAAGLDALLRGRAAQLAPGLDRSAPLLGVVEVLAATHLETFGPGVFPLPPVPLPATARERAAAVRAAPLAATLQRLTRITRTRRCWTWR